MQPEPVPFPQYYQMMFYHVYAIISSKKFLPKPMIKGWIALYRIAICDDESKILEILSCEIKRIISTLGISAEYYISSKPEELLKDLNENIMDILFLDIDMPGITGMEIAEKLLNQKNKVLLVFVTNQEALVYQSFRYHPFGFIRKSFFQEEIEQVLLSAIDMLNKEQNSFVFKNSGQCVRLKLADIIYFEADSNYVSIFTTEKVYRYRESLSILEQQLSAKEFIRIHKGFLVNQQHIFAVCSDHLVLQNKATLPIGRTNRESIRIQLMRYMR